MMKSAVIFYFSGTGNTEFISRLIEGELQANRVAVRRQALDFVEVPDVGVHDAVFLGFPVHGYGVPIPVRRFIARIPRCASKAAVVFATFGGWSCGAEQWAARLLGDRGFRVVALLGIKMPHNNPPGVDIAGQPLAHLVEKARQTVTAEMSRIIQSNELAETHSCSGALVGAWVNPLFVNRQWADFSFPRRAYADERCLHCGTCARICPTRSISMVHGAIHFDEGCSSCLRCFNQCPARAIQVGRRTREAPRYKGPLGDYRCPVVGTKAPRDGVIAPSEPRSQSRE